MKSNKQIDSSKSTTIKTTQLRKLIGGKAVPYLKIDLETMTPFYHS